MPTHVIVKKDLIEMQPFIIARYTNHILRYGNITLLTSTGVKTHVFAHQLPVFAADVAAMTLQYSTAVS